MSVTDLSLSRTLIREHFWCSSLSPLVGPHCVRWSHRWGGVRERDDRWDPIWTDLLSCQLSPRWLETLLVYRQPSKDACPPLRPEQAATPMSPRASLLPVEAKSDTLQSSVHTLAQAQIRSQCVNKCKFLRVDVWVHTASMTILTNAHLFPQR